MEQMDTMTTGHVDLRVVHDNTSRCRENRTCTATTADTSLFCIPQRRVMLEVGFSLLYGKV